MPDPRPAIGLVCKAPRPGAVKTRLAATIGADKAAALATAFLADTAAAIAALPVAPWLIHAPAHAAPEIAPLLPVPFRAHPQCGADLGAVMQDALGAMLAAGHAGAILVGADSPDLPADRWTAALAALANPGNDAVFGPAADGGYWLVGLRAPQPALFETIAWSTSTVLTATCRQAAAADLRLALLEPWFDVDESADLAALATRLAAAPDSVAPATRRALCGLSGLVPRPAPA